MAAPLALQLYTLREAMEGGFEDVVQAVAEIGYAGVEPAGFPGTTPEAARKLFDDLGLEITSAHCPMPAGDSKQESLEIASALGIRRIVSGHGPKNFETADHIKESCDVFNEAAGVAAENGLTFGIHNHWWEFLEVEGQLAYKTMLEHLDPNVFLQIDAYWVQTAGVDPAGVLEELGQRSPLVHLKDGPCERDKDMQALGEGEVDFASLVAAGRSVEWWIVELDRCATDMMEAVRKSYIYMAENGFATGRG